MDTFAFVALPYACLAVFIVGHVWRYRTDQFGWTSRTSQVLEKKWLHAGSPLFHFGALFAILGHAVGLLVPASWTKAIGLSPDTYHAMSITGGVIAGVMLCSGLVILLLRRFYISERVRLATTRMDRVLYVLLTVEILLGMWQTVAINVFGTHFDYRDTLSVWFRDIFLFRPDVATVADVPMIFKIHSLLGFAIIGIWPFTRLVHVWSVPVAYLARPYLVYRRRPQAVGAGR